MKLALALGAAALLFLSPTSARAHCDTLDGPLLATARTALDTGDPSTVLAWVRPEGEQEVRTAFKQALQARTAQPASRADSDRRFFETLVRVHRAGEGAPYTGLKPADEGVTEALRAADHGVAVGDGAEAEALLVEAVRTGLRERFAKLQAETPPGKDVADGRRWVEAYVDYVHHVERLDEAAGAAGPHREGGAVSAEQHVH